MKRQANKYLIPFVTIAVFAPSIVWAAVTDKDTLELINYIGGYYKSFILPIGTVLAGFMIMFGGIKYAISAGEPTKVGQAKEFIVGAITGEILLLAAWAIVGILTQ